MTTHDRPEEYGTPAGFVRIPQKSRVHRDPEMPPDPGPECDHHRASDAGDESSTGNVVISVPAKLLARLRPLLWHVVVFLGISGGVGVPTWMTGSFVRQSETATNTGSSAVSLETLAASAKIRDEQIDKIIGALAQNAKGVADLTTQLAVTNATVNALVVSTDKAIERLDSDRRAEWRSRNPGR